MAHLGELEFRLAGPSDAEAIAGLHADSWRRRYRGGYAEADPVWGALLDNLHVVYGEKRRGLGSRLLAMTARAVLERGTGLYLWVLEQNADARAFYAARGGTCVERAPVPAPNGIEGRLNGSPVGLRYAWPDPAVALAGT